MAKRKAKSRLVGVEIPARIAALLDERARRDMVSRSAVIRQALANHLGYEAAE